MIPQSFIQDLLHRVDIVEVIDRHVRLKRAGANYVACCPFHSEKTPSFTVSPGKQFYHCFGCGAHGTAIGFVMEYSGLGFVDAVKDLAQSVGVSVPEVRSAEGQRRAAQSQDLYAVLLTATHHYRQRLKEAPRGIEYLKSRGLSGEIARRFGIGYAPENWHSLAAAFSDYSDSPALLAAGLVKQAEDGRRYDLFRDRIMFPIVDVRGNVIGFGGRVLGQGEPKYLNSPESPVFEKGRELYGLYQARRAVREAGRVLVVEGYMDVVALAQHGVANAVATLGTATTAQHVEKLLRVVDEVIFCFDGDAAGRRAAWRALEVSLPHLADGKEVRFLFLPEGEDPDSFVRARGEAAFQAELRRACPLSRYLIDEVAGQVDLGSAEGRAGFLHRAKPLVARLPPGAFRAELISELAEKARLTPLEVSALIGLASPAQPRAARPAPTRYREAPSLARKLLRLLLDAPSLAATLTAEQREWLNAGVEFEPVMALVEHIGASGAETPAAVLESTREGPHGELFARVLAESLASGDPDDARAELEGVLRHLELRSVQAQYAELMTRAARSDADSARLQALTARLAELKGAAPVGERAPL
jgi:DNA primase